MTAATTRQRQPAWPHGRRQPCCGSGAGSTWSSPRCKPLVQRNWHRISAAESAAGTEATPLVATEGDIVTVHWKCFSEEGELLESSEQAEEPTTFEVGAGDIVGNRLFEAFDDAVRGMALGDVARIKAEGGEWKEELLFRVPRQHPEMERLAGRYKNQGGLKEGLLVELSNGGMALVVKADEETVVLDANNMLAGKSLWFELLLADIERSSIPFEPSLPPWVLQKGLVSLGDLSRFRRFFHKLLTGQPVTVVALGGSVSWGHGASARGQTDFVALVFKWINATFPHPQHQLLNHAISATPSTYFSLCLQWHVPPNVDMVLLEFNPNDGVKRFDAPARRAHERLIRKLLAHAAAPPLLEMVFFLFAMDQLEGAEIPYRMGGDDEVEVLAQYYNLPYLATRSLLWDAAYDAQGRGNRSAAGAWPYFQHDGNHPNDIGHRYMAEMTILFFHRVLEDLHFRPYAAHDDEVATAPLRVPMLRNNWPNKNNSCLMGTLFSEHVVAAEGFQWVNEGSEEKPKCGWVGTQPGATLRFSVDTATALAAASSQEQAGDSTHVGVMYLRSHEHMGQAELTCLSGCTCDPFRINGWLDWKASQEFYAPWPVTRSAECVIEARILNDTSSGEHKVKLTGVIVSEVAGPLEYHEIRIHVDFNGKDGVGEFEW